MLSMTPFLFPRKAWLEVDLRVSNQDPVLSRLKELGIECGGARRHWRGLWFTLMPGDIEKHREAVKELCQIALADSAA